jgi:hypothetical protein
MSDVTGTVCTYGDRARGRGVRINAHEWKDCGDEIALRKQSCIREEKRIKLYLDSVGVSEELVLQTSEQLPSRKACIRPS